MKKSIELTKGDEIGNAITHGIGFLLAIAGFIVLLLKASWEGTGLHLIGFAIFGSSLTLLYLISTLYHGFNDQRLKKIFQKLDHMAIYLLIAGTYTPFCLMVLPGYWKWFMLVIIWGGALSGIILKAFYTGRKKMLSTSLYILLGFLILFAIHHLYERMTLQGFLYVIFGGVFYTSGTFFYLRDKFKYYHMIWHLFVLSGSAFHFFAVHSLLYINPAGYY
ncbi:MAG: PAQR family membrane homeostasis protein TrhA [Candidatus Cyclobacteriaceae bacterium M2_1C_046]